MLKILELEYCSLRGVQDALRSLGLTTEDTALFNKVNLCFLYGSQNKQQLRTCLRPSGKLQCVGLWLPTFRYDLAVPYLRVKQFHSHLGLNDLKPRNNYYPTEHQVVSLLKEMECVTCAERTGPLHVYICTVQLHTMKVFFINQRMHK